MGVIVVIVIGLNAIFSAQDRLYMAANINDGGRTRENPGKNDLSTCKLSHIPTLAEPRDQANRGEMAVIRNGERFRPLAPMSVTIKGPRCLILIYVVYQ